MDKSQIPDYKYIDGEKVALTDQEKEKLAAERTPSLSERKESVLLKVKELRNKNAHKAVTYDGNQFDADPQAQQKLTGKLTYAQTTGKDTDSTWSVGWKTANNDFVQLSYTDLENVVGAVNAQIQAAYNREAEILAQIEQATTIEELNAISIESGWP